MKRLHIVELDPIFPHERTELYRRTRELHAFAAQLEINAGNTRYFSALTHAGLLAMLSTASAGVAPTDRTRTRHLASVRDRLARFASALRSMADRGLLEDDVVKFGNGLVKNAEDQIADFDAELRCIESELLAVECDARRALGDVRPANEESPPSELDRPAPRPGLDRGGATPISARHPQEAAREPSAKGAVIGSHEAAEHSSAREKRSRRRQR